MALFNGLASVQFLGHDFDGQTTSNTFHIHNSGAGSPPDFAELETLGTQLLAQFTTEYRGMGGTAWTWDSIITRQVFDPLAPVVYEEAVTAVDLAGTRTTGGPYCPQGLCGVISMKTPNASRRFRGHMFLPPTRSADQIDGNVFQVTEDYWLNGVTYAAELFKGTPLGSGWTGSALSDYGLVIYSKRAAQLSLASVANVSSVVMKPKVSFLRSRERGGT